MAKWKLCRQSFGSEEYTFSEGDEVTIGRGNNNIVTLSSAVISRNHCVISVHNNKAVITDLQSSNGVYVGTNKIPPNTPYIIDESDLIGLGWTIGAPLVNINDSEKYLFKVTKAKCKKPLTSRLTFQSDNEIEDDIEAKIAKIEGNLIPSDIKNKENNKSPVLNTKLSLKRKIDPKVEIKQEAINKVVNNDSVICISDSDNDTHTKSTNTGAKKPRLQAINEEPKLLLKESEIKNENELIEYDAFSVKQEYLGYDDEPIKIDSESDSESEQWLLRLSQNSPGKPFVKVPKIVKPEVKPEDGSYSQLDDDFIGNHLLFEDEDDDDDDFMEDIISIPQPEEECQEVPDINKVPGKTPDEETEFSDDIISIAKPAPAAVVSSRTKEEKSRDEVDAFSTKQTEKHVREALVESPKRAQMIEPLAQLPKAKSNRDIVEKKSSKSSSSKHSSSKTEKSHSKKHISNSQKEERKKKLKELATKGKDGETKSSRDSTGSSKPVTNIKVTSSNRGAFLTDVAQAVVKPVKRKENVNKSKDKISEPSPKIEEILTKSEEAQDQLEQKKDKKAHKDKHKPSKHNDSKNMNDSNKYIIKKTTSEQDTRVPLKSVKPLKEGEESFSGKPISKVGPMQPEKTKKKVRFSDAPQIRVFEIEPGNRMKKTSLIKVDIQQARVFSLEKITLMKVLRWNPQWLEEQLNNNDPPPILGHNNTPLTLFHTFANHNQYVQLVGDLLLMEIWECLTIAYMKTRDKPHGLHMVVQSLPPIPTMSQERLFELFTLTVNVSLAPSETRNLPRVGEVMLIQFGPENARNQRFFFVHNIRYLPAPPGLSKYLYSISLQATFTDKMMLLKPGEVLVGKSLAYINNELMLFEAMEYLAGSPLSDAILKPEPHHFASNGNSQIMNLNSPWTTTLNPSQLKAVSSSVAAALGDQPAIQMVQGPPGTGKSSVICAIVMSYFYNEQGQRQSNRGKILICATSNAAVDGLVIRLLTLRQSLPKHERFRMVRVGRAEAMHAVAADVSSQQLALRDLARAHEQPPAVAGLNEEITRLEAKVNMWKTTAQDAKNPERVAYCQGRVNELIKRINLLRSGGGGGGRGEEPRPEQVASCERRIIEGAHIIVTTLASAHSHKMKGLKRRIALCIIDEAGQVIEPVTLIPLTLDVTKLTLIGDPQQLPGYICSQRAKKHGLSESLFARLTSCTDDWASGSPVILLNQQYRMHPAIADYPNRAFYGGVVRSQPAPPDPRLPLPPYTILGIASGDKGQGISGANEMEAWGVTRLVLALDALLRPLNMNLAVITPYNAHKDLIKKHLKMLQNQGEPHVEVNTVDSFQGQERDVVVVSLARSQGVGFLTDAGRMNVMLTRAKHALLVCLNPYALLKNHQWRTLVEDAQRRELFKTLPSKMCQPINAAQVPNDDVLKYIINESASSSSHHRGVC